MLGVEKTLTLVSARTCFVLVFLPYVGWGTHGSSWGPCLSCSLSGTYRGALGGQNPKPPEGPVRPQSLQRNHH